MSEKNLVQFLIQPNQASVFGPGKTKMIIDNTNRYFRYPAQKEGYKFNE